MRVTFVSARPADAVDLALLVAKDGVVAAVATEAGADALQAAAKFARFEGEAGSVAEYASAEGGVARRVLLAGVGAGTPEDHEKAGSALCARLLTSGTRSLTVDASGVSAQSAARLAAAMVLRGWRYDKYRTRLTDKQKPTLDEVIVINADPNVETAWASASAGHGRSLHRSCFQ